MATYSGDQNEENKMPNTSARTYNKSHGPLESEPNPSPTFSPQRNMIDRISNLPKAAPLKIHFVIVGAGLAGLATAISLRRIGHNVTVLEKSKSPPMTSGGTRIPPNASKIFFSWGYEQGLRAITLKSGALHLYLQSTGESLGTHVWDEEVLKETRGEFLFAHHCDLWRFLLAKATALGATVRMNSTVISIDANLKKVVLSSGDQIYGDVIIGADGLLGVSRATLLSSQEDFEELPKESSITLSMYSFVVPNSAIEKEDELASFLEEDQTTLRTWFGHSRGVLAFPVGGTPEFAVYAYGPKSEHEKTWTEPITIKDANSIFGSCESRLKKLGSLADSAVCIPVDDVPELEDWVDGRLVVVGNAAHPLPPGSIQECALGVEDAAVLGRLFSHLSSEDQISSFLWAFQDIRQERCASITRKEREIVQFITAETGTPLQQGRDEAMRAKRDAGVYALRSLGNTIEETQEWLDIKDVFAYDAEDEADNWWVQWGLLRERANYAEFDSPEIHAITYTHLEPLY
ncbi:hypothetical protein VNI00_010791 [Paramarasmius palmivorus]|uniref:FAD-binding domain-containing protein n=1 Tax=Paramarasmius palmivorus TaxID=297713 RepID=A0AAW0CF35_9AGAR